MAASALMNVMVGAARKAGRSLARDFGEVAQLQVSVKGPANFVTAADQRAEEIVYRELARARQGYGFLMEEGGEIVGDDKTHRWIIDPLDGTTNFLHSIPLFGISIALERDGAFLNDKRLRVAARKTLQDSVISTGIPFRGRGGYERFNDETAPLMREVAGLRRTGAASIDLAWTAAGRFDGYWEHDLQPWDIAAGIVILIEAGGIATDIQGGENMLDSGSIVAGNPTIQKLLLASLKRPA
jgi:myo-inositol-1(or 4)-monophosphatase